MADDIDKIMTGKPKDADGFIDALYKEIATDQAPRETIKVVQFSDAHMDMEYTVGTVANCDQSYCCRPESTRSESQEKLAGKFGMKNERCDPPRATFESVLDQVIGQKPDLVFWTGDNTPHDDPYINQDSVTATLEAIIGMV